jgi:hypothetical protein
MGTAEDAAVVLRALTVSGNALPVPLHLRWQPRPWLVSVALVALLPAMALWAAALADSFGIAHVLAAFPAPATATSRPERLLLVDTFLTVTLVLPLLAGLSAVLAMISFELRIAGWEMTVSLRLPSPPWDLQQVVAALLLLIGAALFIAMAGHLAADCLIGSDCVAG